MIITSPHYNRPEFTKEMIEYLSAVDGIENCFVIFSVDADKDGIVNEEVLSLISNYKGSNFEVLVAKENIGCNQNALKVMFRGFSIGQNSWIMHIEDDVCVSKDVLKYTKECMYDTRYNISLYNRSKQKATIGAEHTIGARNWFTPSGIAINRENFRLAVSNDCFFHKKYTWDIQYNKLCLEHKIKELYPILSRSKNIGWYGTNISSPEWFKENIEIIYWAGDVKDLQDEIFKHHY